ncbi:MAG: hypothetical protein JST14_19020 [Bacteroidetes bacterium]|nr:hypothetical protein [Bacteroidota bacterium]
MLPRINRNKIRLIGSCILLSTLILFQPVCAQQLEFIPVEGPNGTPLGKIRNITQDPQGYIWMAGEDKGQSDSYIGCIYRFDGVRMRAFTYDPENPNSLGGTVVNSVYADNKGIIWIGLQTGLDRYDPRTGIFTHYVHDSKDSTSVSGVVTPIISDHQGRLWVGTGNGIDLLDESTGKFKHYRNIPGDPKSISSNIIWNLYEDRSGVLWVATGKPFYNQGKDWEDGGLNRLEPDGTFTRFKHDSHDPHSLISNKVRAMFEDSRGTFWVGTSGDGLHTLDRKTGKFVRHLFDPSHQEKLSRPRLRRDDEFIYNNDQVSFIQEDAMGSIWIGSMWAGINRYDTATKKITHYEGTHGFPDSSGWNIFQSRDKVLWITTQQNHVYRVDPYRGKIRNINLKVQPSAFLNAKDGHLWVGTSEGLLVLDKNMRVLRNFTHDPGNPTSLFGTGLQLFQDSQDTIWIGASKGFGYFDVKQETFSTIRPQGYPTALDSVRVLEIARDRGGKLWISTWGNGLFRYDPVRNAVQNYLPADNSNSISSKDLTRLHIDRYGIMWVGSIGKGLNRQENQGEAFSHYLKDHIILSFYEDENRFLVGTNRGLYQYDRTNDRFTLFGDMDELRTRIYGMVADDRFLWISTPSAVVRLEKNSMIGFVYGPRHGIAGGSLTPGSTMHKTSDGRVLKGTYDGFLIFDPRGDNVSTVSRIILSEVSINNHPVMPTPDGPLREPVEVVSQMILAHDQNNISFSFGSDDYRTLNGVKYFTRLQGYDNVWRDAQASKSASYYYVPPGSYVFHIRIYNNDGVMSERSVAIEIQPPWWRTLWAYGLYGISGLGLIFTFDRFQKRRIRRIEKEKSQARELAQAKEIEKAYSELKATQAQLIQTEKMASLGEMTAGIAHEIQNPLNFVNNFSEVSNELLDEMKEELVKGNASEASAIADDVKQNIEKVLHHGKRADAIVKSMLQHSRSSSGQKELTDINALCDEYLRLAYHGLRAKDKTFSAKFETDLDPTVGKLNVVSQDIGRVILNLINNAFYAVAEKKKQSGDQLYEPQVLVRTKRDGNQIKISVADNGNGIPTKVLDKIFQPFFTTKPTGQGTGLGLSLSYDIITKGHGGELKVQTKENEGSTFYIVLPV